MIAYQHKEKHGEFKRDLIRGKKGEKIFLDHHREKGTEIILANSEEDKFAGIDFFLNKHSVQLKFEESYCRYQENINDKIKYTGNIAFELYSDCDRYVLGGHLTSKAEYIIHLMGDYVALYFKANRLRKFLMEEIITKDNNYKCSYNISKSKGQKWHSKTVNITFDVLKEKKLLIKEEVIKKCE